MGGEREYGGNQGLINCAYFRVSLSDMEVRTGNFMDVIGITNLFPFNNKTLFFVERKKRVLKMQFQG